MIGKVFKLEIDCHKYCGELLQSLCVHQFGIQTQGTVLVPLANISGIITSFNIRSYSCLAVISNTKMPSTSAMFLPVHPKIAQENEVSIIVSLMKKVREWKAREFIQR